MTGKEQTVGFLSLRLGLKNSNLSYTLVRATMVRENSTRYLILKSFNTYRK
jgi:hypothetical protein